MNDIPPDDLDFDDEDFRTFWQRPAFKFPAGLLAAVALIVLLIQIGIVDWAKDRFSDAIGEARYAQRGFTEDVLEHTAMGELHKELLPAYAHGIIRSSHPAGDERITELRDNMKQSADDDELSRLIDELHEKLTSEDYDVVAIEDAWNKRLQDLNEPYAIVGATIEDHHDLLYMPETYRIIEEVDVDIDGRTHTVEWRHRLDNFRRAAEPTFYDEELDRAFVRSDRGWITAWDKIVPLLMTEEELEEIGETIDRRTFGWRAELRQEVREFLGKDHFEALIRGGLHRQHMEAIAVEVARRARECNSNFRILRVPWFGFDTDELDYFREMARADRFDSCGRLTQDEASQLRRHSRDLQSDFTYQESMPRLLAAFLAQKTIMAAAYRHRSTSKVGPPCADCEQWTDADAAEIGGYLTGTIHGPHPHIGLLRLCFDHRYGSPASYRGWLLLLREHGFHCGEELPDALIELLRAYEEENFTPIDSISFSDDAPEEAPIYHRD